jgi:hypothetical protein
MVGPSMMKGIRPPIVGVAGAVVAVVVFSLVAARYGGTSHRWNWTLGATVGTALGTTTLAVATFLLAYGIRRPRLELRAGKMFKLHSRVEGNGCPYLRLVVANAAGRRSAHGTRVLVETYQRRGGNFPVTALGSPSLGWPSAPDAVDGSVIVFAGSGRPVDFGSLRRVVNHAGDPEARWLLRLGLPDDFHIKDQREYLEPGRYTVRLVVGADEADARSYDVDVEWDGNADTPQKALASVNLTLRPVG